jgi:hypothetical protein
VLGVKSGRVRGALVGAAKKMQLPHVRALFGLDRRDAAMSENGQTQPIAALILHP